MAHVEFPGGVWSQRMHTLAQKEACANQPTHVTIAINTMPPVHSFSAQQYTKPWLATAHTSEAASRSARIHGFPAFASARAVLPISLSAACDLAWWKSGAAETSCN
eukprot:3766392-Prymnesium_polylepis.1